MFCCFIICSFGSVVEHCVSSTKGCGFNSQGTHILTKNVISLNLLWIKASAKCINVKGIVHPKILIMPSVCRFCHGVLFLYHHLLKRCFEPK